MILAGELRSDPSGTLDGAGARVSLRTKAVAAFVLLLLYVVSIGFLIAQQRDTLRATVEEQRALYPVEEALSRVNSALAYAILHVNDTASASSRMSAETIALDVEAVQAGLQRIKDHYAVMESWIGRLERSTAMVRNDWSDENLVMLRDFLHELVTELDRVTSEVRDRQQALSERFRTAYDSITLTSIVMGLLGAVVFGGLVMLFFSRLVRDIRSLQARAVEVVTGYRGSPIAITRHDELGGLMSAVNRMQSELREREKQLEIARQQRFHHEKMSAIGSLAAAIAHEVNNPIAAITGVAEAIHDTQNSCACAGRGCRPELILEQTRRIQEITQQLAEITAPSPPDPALLDVNSLVRRTCAFIRYDKRFRNIELQLDLDPQVPAINGVADHLTQVLMNLLINAADATEHITGREPSISVETKPNCSGAVLVVADNGCGMDAQTLARAFDEAFTTKPLGKGSGLGLFMCRSLMESHGGRIEIQTAVGEGTRVSIHMPHPMSGG
ncbi:MAG: ATP-binding protein [Betaproteobacteria bacterium]